VCLYIHSFHLIFKPIWRWEDMVHNNKHSDIICLIGNVLGQDICPFW
jgi:hypothetical protein